MQSSHPFQGQSDVLEEGERKNGFLFGDKNEKSTKKSENFLLFSISLIKKEIVIASGLHKAVYLFSTPQIMNRNSYNVQYTAT